MVTKTLNISVSMDLYNFLEENPQIPRSKLFQQAVINIQNSLRCNPALIEANKEIERLKKAVQFLNNQIEKSGE